MCNPCISPLTMWERIQLMKRCTTLCDKVCQWLATGRWFSSVSLTNKTHWNDIPELLLKVALNTSILTLTNRPSGTWYSFMNQEGDSIPTWNAWSWLLRHFVLCIICPSAFMTVCLVFCLHWSFSLVSSCPTEYWIYFFTSTLYTLHDRKSKYQTQCRN